MAEPRKPASDEKKNLEGIEEPARIRINSTEEKENLRTEIQELERKNEKLKKNKEEEETDDPDELKNNEKDVSDDQKQNEEKLRSPKNATPKVESREVSPMPKDDRKRGKTQTPPTGSPISLTPVKSQETKRSPVAALRVFRTNRVEGEQSQGNAEDDCGKDSKRNINNYSLRHDGSALKNFAFTYSIEPRSEEKKRPADPEKPSRELQSILQQVYESSARPNTGWRIKFRFDYENSPKPKLQYSTAQWPPEISSAEYEDKAKLPENIGSFSSFQIDVASWEGCEGTLSHVEPENEPASSAPIIFKNLKSQFLLDYAVYCAIDYKEIKFDEWNDSGKPWLRYSVQEIKCLIDGPFDEDVIKNQEIEIIESENVQSNFIEYLIRIHEDILENLQTHKKTNLNKSVSRQLYEQETNCSICMAKLNEPELTYEQIIHCARCEERLSKDLTSYAKLAEFVVARENGTKTKLDLSNEVKTIIDDLLKNCSTCKEKLLKNVDKDFIRYVASDCCACKNLLQKEDIVVDKIITDCDSCSKKIFSLNKAHIHHDHRTNDIYGPSHPKCNLNAKSPKFLPIFVRCKNSKDFRGLILTLFGEGIGQKKELPKETSSVTSWTFKPESSVLTFYHLNSKDKEKEYFSWHLLNVNNFLGGRNLQDITEELFSNSYGNGTIDGNPLQFEYIYHKLETSETNLEKITPAITTTFQAADVLSLIRTFYFKKFELDLYYYESLQNFILDVILKVSKVIITFYYLSEVTPYPGTIEYSSCFDQDKVSLFYSKVFKTPLPVGNFTKIDEEFISSTNFSLDESKLGYIYEVKTKNGEKYHVHSFLLNFILTNKNLKEQNDISQIRRVLQFEQEAFMVSFADLTRTLTIPNDDYPEKFGNDLKELFLKNILEYLTSFPEECQSESAVVSTPKHLKREIQTKNFTSISIFGENIVEVHFPSAKKEKQKLSVLSLAIRDIAYASYAIELMEKANTKEKVTELLGSLKIKSAN